MFLAGWWVGGFWGGTLGTTAAIVVWISYAMIDVAVLVMAGMTAKIAAFMVVSLLTKLVSVYLGALVSARST